jgi:hypothetical protein
MCHKHYNVRKGLKNTSFNGNLSMKLCTYKETTIMNNLPHYDKVMKLMLNDTKIFFSTLCYYNVNDYDIFKLQNVLPLKM